MTSPPKFILRLFEWFCDPRLHRGIEGDLLELFDENVSRKGAFTAKLLFVADVLKLCRPALIRPLEGAFKLNQYGLIKHNLLISLRIIKRDKFYSALNVSGLSLGLATFIAMMLYVQHEESFDQFHQNKDRIYRITADYTIDDMDRRFLASTPPRIAPFAKEKIPEIDKQVRIHDYFSSDNSDLTFAVGDRKFREQRVIFSSSDFFEVFSFELLRGNVSDCLDQIGSVILTKSTAERYFGKDDPIGQFITLDGIANFHFVSGVMQDPPSTSHFQFDILMSYETLNWWYEGEAETHWTAHDYYSFLLLKENTNPKAVAEKINQYYLEQRGDHNNAKQFDHHFDLQPLHDIHLTANLERESVNTKTTPRLLVNGIYFLGWLILLIAWINYFNLSTARSNRRLEELKTRRALGAKKNQLSQMLLIETGFIHVGALFIACLLLFVSEYQVAQLFGVDFSWETISSLFTPTRLGYSLLGLLVIIVGYQRILGSSSFLNPKTRTHDRNSSSSLWYYRILTVFQFAVSISLIIGTIAIYNQLNHIKNKSLGFDQYNKLVIRGANLTSEDSYDEYIQKNKVFKEDLLAHSSVRQVTTADRIPGSRKGDMATIKLKKESQSEGQPMELVGVGARYFETLHIELLEGIQLKEAHTEGIPVILNTTAVQLLGFKTPEEALMKKLVSNDEYGLTVVGVIADYHQVSAAFAIDPSIYYLEEGYIYHYIVDYQGAAQELLTYAEKAMKTVFPRDPIDFYFLDDHFNRQHADDERLSSIILTFSILAVVIACLGLIGLSSHHALRREKEIGIRKTFGAGRRQILLLLNRETGWLLLIANLIAWPAIYWLMKLYLEDFESRISLGFELFVGGSIALMILAVAVVSLVSLQAVRMNPVDLLKSE